MISDRSKKNILDLSYNRYLQYFNTCIILLFTYIIGIIIGLITKQINYLDSIQLLIAILVTIIAFGLFVILLSYFHKHLKEIVEEIKTLNL